MHATYMFCGEMNFCMHIYLTRTFSVSRNLNGNLQLVATLKTNSTEPAKDLINKTAGCNYVLTEGFYLLSFGEMATITTTAIQCISPIKKRISAIMHRTINGILHHFRSVRLE